MYTVSSAAVVAIRYVTSLAFSYARLARRFVAQCISGCSKQTS